VCYRMMRNDQIWLKYTRSWEYMNEENRKVIFPQFLGVTRWMSYKKQEPAWPSWLRAHEFTPGFWRVSFAHLFSFLCCPKLCVLTFWVPCCDVRYDFHIETMFGSSLPPAVCRRSHVLFTLLVFVFTLCCLFLWIVHLWYWPFGTVVNH
jgi:hypothetical protein